MRYSFIGIAWPQLNILHINLCVRVPLPLLSVQCPSSCILQNVKYVKLRGIKTDRKSNSAINVFLCWPKWRTRSKRMKCSTIVTILCFVHFQWIHAPFRRYLTDNIQHDIFVCSTRTTAAAVAARAKKNVLIRHLTKQCGQEQWVMQ